jgi:hypothetical protein
VEREGTLVQRLRSFQQIEALRAGPEREREDLMKTKRTAIAAMLMMLMPAAPAFPQAEVSPDHFADAPEAQVSYVSPDHQAAPQAYSRELQAQADVVEDARQEAISAGIVGDGAGSYIDEYRNQVSALEGLRAKLEKNGRALSASAR